MSNVQEFESDIILPPNNLPNQEPPLETDLHKQQMILLIESLEWWFRKCKDFYISGNQTIYYKYPQESDDLIGADFFVVLGTEREPRESWVVWAEDGKYPNVIVELLSDRTALIDKGLKKEFYQNVFRVPDYFWFNPQTLEFAGFHLVSTKYKPLEPNSQGWLWSQQLNLYLGIDNQQLRFFTPEKQLVKLPGEIGL
jgi:Uma2 family endonuclease